MANKADQKRMSAAEFKAEFKKNTVLRMELKRTFTVLSDDLELAWSKQAKKRLLYSAKLAKKSPAELLGRWVREFNAEKKKS